MLRDSKNPVPTGRLRARWRRGVVAVGSWAVRNNADTVWMKEREVEAAYRRRFDERRYANEALDRLYGELSAVTEVEARA
jgi:hypothetical protein